MPRVPIELLGKSVAYDVCIEPGALGRLGDMVRAVAPHDRACLIVDHGIETSHGRVAARSMEAAGFDTVVAIMPGGEKNKTLGTVRGLHEVMLEARLERGSPLVAVGGGITGDTAGFVAASYQRGVPFVQVPTTLLSMVDASVGGKTGVNVPQGKNLIGAFWQPKLVLADPQVLRTLPDRELRCGLAECLKHGMLGDAELLEWMQRNHKKILSVDDAVMSELVARNVAIKANVVIQDEREAGIRAHLNLGHTFAHAIESATEYTAYLHGEAVALGLIAATRLAAKLKRCPGELPAFVTNLVEQFGLPTGSYG